MRDNWVGPWVSAPTLSPGRNKGKPQTRFASFNRPGRHPARRKVAPRRDVSAAAVLAPPGLPKPSAEAVDNPVRRVSGYPIIVPRFRFHPTHALAALTLCLAASCGTDEPASDPTPEGPGATRTPEPIVQAWVDPGIDERFLHRERQRVIVVLHRHEKETVQHEHADEPGASRRPSVFRRARLQRASAKDRLLRKVASATPAPVHVVYRYPPFPLLALDLDRAQVAALATHPEARRIYADREDEPELDTSLPAIATPWFHQHHAAGEGTAVAVLDSPIRYDNGHFGSCPKPGAQGCAVAVWEGFAPDSPQEVIDAEDAAGKSSHGTNVAAIVHGVAPQAQLLGLNVFYWNDSDDAMRSRVSDQLDALAWVADHADTHDIVAVNMSIGGVPEGSNACNDISRYEAIRTLWDEHGVLTVVSSGNDGEANGTAPPSCISLTVTVGAHFDTEIEDYDGSCIQVDPVDRQIACFSNLSGMVDLIAPGVYIDAGGYRKSGTSMAAPHVAGAIAAWQSWFLQDQGDFKSPFWMHKRLLMQSSAPHVHVDGRRYQRLDFDQSAQWNYGRSFPYWYRDTGDNEIPSDGSFYETSFDVSGKGWDIQSAYLVLDLIHSHPEDLDIRLQAPDGQVAFFGLPSGQAHFTGVVGRTVQPGALAALEGAPVDGTWSLRLRDTAGSDAGHYLQAALYFVRQGCIPNCVGEACGDDGCGQDCGPLCLIEGTCVADGETEPENPCRICIPGVSDTTWTNVEGKACDDGNACTLEDRCSGGACHGDPMTCPSPGPCETNGVCNEATGDCEYAPRADGTACSDGNDCTEADACQDGTCVGTPVACSPPGVCQLSEGCDPATGECSYAPAEDGAPCPSGTCHDGTCVPSGTGGASAGGAPGNEGGADDAGGDAGGCGCRTARSPGFHTWFPWLALAALLRRRRIR